MTIRTILAAAGGGAATAGGFELACQLARRFEAHLEGFHVTPDARAVLAAATDGLGGPGTAGLVESAMAEAAEKAAATRAAFDEAVARHGIVHAGWPRLAVRGASAAWQQQSGEAGPLVAARARFFDLAVLGRSDRVDREPYSDTIEETLLRSGRPLLLAPAQPPAGIGHVVAVAWNGSP